MKMLRGISEVREFVSGRSIRSLESIPEEVSRRIHDIFGRQMTPAEVVSHILSEVRSKGDSAIRDLTHRIDGLELESLEVDRASFRQAVEEIPRDLRDAFDLATRRINGFARASLPKTWHDKDSGLGEMVVPMDRVGVYAPGGTAVYPSTILMAVGVARAIGVKEIILCTPLRDDARPNSVILAAAQIAGVDRVFRIGGAQAIAAMAYGTESIPPVDKVCGPGNVFVTLAKQQLFGQVGIDGVFGPTETVVVADQWADPRLCAADLLAQAEHDLMASPILIATSEKMSKEVQAEITRQVRSLDRRDITLAALENQGAVVLVDNLDEALEAANLFAPEHMNLLVRNPWKWVGKVRHAGAVFVGEQSAEVLGDYVAGPSHTLPTHGTARFASYLGADQFVKRIPIIALDDNTVRKLAPVASIIARSEGFTAHAAAADMRAGLQKSEDAPS
jgi:histidinol dehydrogenase